MVVVVVVAVAVRHRPLLLASWKLQAALANLAMAAVVVAVAVRHRPLLPASWKLQAALANLAMAAVVAAVAVRHCPLLLASWKLQAALANLAMAAVAVAAGERSLAPATLLELQTMQRVLKTLVHHHQSAIPRRKMSLVAFLRPVRIIEGPLLDSDLFH
jgi:hypothetical protein